MYTMQDLFVTPDSELSMSLRAIRDEIKRRHWPNAQLMKGKHTFLELTRPDGKVLHTQGCTPPTTSYYAGILADDKLASAKLLQSIDAPHPETHLVPIDSEARHRLAESMLSHHATLILKPIDGAHGYGIHTDLTSVEDVESAFADNRNTFNLLQEQLYSDTPELRVICIDYQFVAAFARHPAAVTGDGVHTVAELIDIENSTIRTAPYKSNLAFIDKTMSTAYLQNHHIGDNVPQPGEKVRVVSTCNTGCGGTMEDVTGSISAAQRALSEKISRTFELPVIGVDFFGDYVIEVNSTPALYHPVSGASSTFCVKKLIDYLETI